MKKIRLIIFCLFVCFFVEKTAEAGAVGDKISELLESAKTGDVVVEPFPIEGIDLLGVPIFKGFSDPEWSVFDMMFLCAYAQNEKLLTRLNAEVESGDFSSAGILFVLADRVFSPKKRKRTVDRLGKIIIPMLPDCESADFGKAIKKWDPIVLFMLYKYCNQELVDRHENLPFSLILESSSQCDVAFKSLVDFYIKTNKINELNALIIATRGQGNVDRNILLDAYSKSLSDLGIKRFDWKVDSLRVISDRFHHGFHNFSSYALLLGHKMSSDEGNAQECKQILRLLVTRYLEDAYSLIAGCFQKESDEYVFWNYMVGRSRYSLEAYDVLWEYFIRKDDIRNARILYEFVKISGETNVMQEKINAWCKKKISKMDGEVLSADVKEIQELISSGFYENENFEREVRNAFEMRNISIFDIY